MEITDILAQMGGLQSMARELGVSEAQAASGAEALLPAILGGFKKQAQAQPTGLEGLGGLLGQLGGGGLLDDVLVAAADGREPRQRRARADLRLQGREPRGRAERGLAVGARPGAAQEDAADAGDAGRRLHGQAAGRRRRAQRPPRRAAAGSAACWGACSAAAGRRQRDAGGAASGLASMLDLNGDGNPLDDILRMAGMGKR